MATAAQGQDRTIGTGGQGGSAAPSAESSPTIGVTEPLPRIRKLIAERLVESLRVAAQLTTVMEIDVTRIAELRLRAKAGFAEREGVRLSFLPFFCVAALEALQEHPRLNASVDLDRGEATFYRSRHLAVAVDTERGLLVPVIRDAGDLGLAELARRIDDLATRARTNKLRLEELSGGTFTITNTGSRGALFDTPIINQPQVAILGTGAVIRRPAVVVEDGREVVAIRSITNFAITYDHRLVDGADAARFLGTIRRRLEAGEFERDIGLA